MDPQNALFCCGAECGIAATGTASGGTEHWSGVTGTPTISTTTVRSPGIRSIRCNASAATVNIAHSFASAVASPATVVARFYVYFASLPGSTVTIFRALGSANNPSVEFNATDNSIRARAISTSAASGFVVTTGQWYRVDFKGVFNTTCTSDIQVDGYVQAQASAAGAAATCTGVSMGFGGSVTSDLFVDDVIVSGTSGDYPIGPGNIVGLYPNGDSTNAVANTANENTAGSNWGHWWSNTTDFGKGASGGTATGAQEVESTSWQSLANPLSTSIATNWIADLAGTSVEKIVWGLDNMPAAATGGTVNGVMCVVAAHASAATSCRHSIGVLDNNLAGSFVTPINDVDLSETTITVAVGMVPLKAGSPTNWTVSALNQQRIRFWSTDVSPDPYVDGVCLEVDWSPAPLAPEPLVVPTRWGLSQSVHRATVR